MPKPVRLSVDKINQALASDKVRAALDARARRILPRAQREAAEAGALEFSKALRVESGIRPGTKSPTGIERPYARVVAKVTPEMDEADEGAVRGRHTILRRASRV